uniref:sensor histidine kinase n=1 Tax=Pararhizobium sp. IMCC3301 TaxID=3067904 RepID=UPI0027423309|nr:ATP-binding protein [Pararhizobium sp. IMCC3301]
MTVSDTHPDTGMVGLEGAQFLSERSEEAGFRPLLFGLAAKIALWTTLCGAIIAAGTVFFMYQGAVDALVEREQFRLSSSINTTASRFASRTEFASRDTLFLSQTLPVEGIVRAQLNGGIDPETDLSEAEWTRRLAALFEVLLENRPAYFRLRYIKIADGGHEVVRVERPTNGMILRTPTAQLQEKGQEPFFREAAKLTDGAVYMSDFELDRDFGRIVEPYRPVVRTAAPVFDDAGILRGELVVNVDATYWFDLLQETLGADEQLMIANQNGDFLVHPDPALPFGFDRGERQLMQDHMPHLSGLFSDKAQSYSTSVRTVRGEELAFARRVSFGKAEADRYIVMVATLDGAALFQRINSLRYSTVLLALVLIIAVGIVAVLLARIIIRPLRDLTVAATNIAAGARDFDLRKAVHRKDETGALARAFEEMVAGIMRRELDLKAKTEELSRSNQELSQFAYIASHDLQEPLRMVSSYLGLLSRRYSGKLDTEADEFIGFAVDGAVRMKCLINDLLAYSRVSNRPLNREMIDTGQVVQSALQALSERLAECDGKIDVGPLPVIEADSVQMERLFTNLIENAIKYRSELPPQVSVAAEFKGDFWEFAISDNGLGIAPEFREKVFVIFTRLHSRDKYQGTGIGLASCKRIVERHGGTIWIDPAPEDGTTFRFTLPALQHLEKRDNGE